ncbi:hypothetical protein SCA6_011043, partial [Theobroma cacao]
MKQKLIEQLEEPVLHGDGQWLRTSGGPHGERDKTSDLRIRMSEQAGDVPVVQGDGQQRAESGLGDPNVSVGILEGSGEHSPMGGQSVNQTNSLVGNNQAILTSACPQERMEDYVGIPPTQESTS